MDSDTAAHKLKTTTVVETIEKVAASNLKKVKLAGAIMLVNPPTSRLVDDHAITHNNAVDSLFEEGRKNKSIKSELALSVALSGLSHAFQHALNRPQNNHHVRRALVDANWDLTRGIHSFTKSTSVVQVSFMFLCSSFFSTSICLIQADSLHRFQKLLWRMHAWLSRL